MILAFCAMAASAILTDSNGPIVAGTALSLLQSATSGAHPENSPGLVAARQALAPLNFGCWLHVTFRALSPKSAPPLAPSFSTQWAAVSSTWSPTTVLVQLMSRLAIKVWKRSVPGQSFL